MSKEEIARFVLKNQGLIKKICTKYRILEMEKDDVVQQVFINMSSYSGKSLGEEDCYKLLVTITNNYCLNYVDYLSRNFRSSNHLEVSNEAISSSRMYNCRKSYCQIEDEIINLVINSKFFFPGKIYYTSLKKERMERIKEILSLKMKGLKIKEIQAELSYPIKCTTIVSHLELGYAILKKNEKELKDRVYDYITDSHINC